MGEDLDHGDMEEVDTRHDETDHDILARNVATSEESVLMSFEGFSLNNDLEIQEVDRTTPTISYTA